MGQQVARLLGALVAEIGHALVADCLGAKDLVRVLDLPSGEPQGRFVREEARRYRDVEPEWELFGGSKEELGAPAGEVETLGHGTQDELRLPARAQLRLDEQRPRPLLDFAVEPSQNIALQRRQHGLAVALEREGARCVEGVDAWLSEATTEHASNEPLQLDSSRWAHGEEIGQASSYGVSLDAATLELRRRERAPVEHGRSSPHPRPDIASRPRRQAREVAREVEVRLPQADEDVEGGVERRPPAQARALSGEIAAALVRALLAVVEVASVAIDLPTAGDTQELHIRFRRLKRADDRKHPRPLVLAVEPRVRRERDLERRPRIADAFREDAVAVDERDRCFHRPTSACSRAIRSVA